MDIIDHAVKLCCECDNCLDLLVDSFIFESYKVHFEGAQNGCGVRMDVKIRMENAFLVYLKMRTHHREFFTWRFKNAVLKKINLWIKRGNRQLRVLCMYKKLI